MSLPARHETPSQALVELDAYAHNLRVVGEMVPKGCAIVPVVKANAYGHGAVPIALRAIKEGVTSLAVATVQEAVALRREGISGSMLVMVSPPEDALGAIVEHDLEVMLSDVARGQRLGELARRANKIVPVHCKIDTGMGRQGFDAEEAVQKMSQLTRVSHIDIRAVCTHLAVADDAGDPFTNAQLKLFRQLLRQVEKEGIPFETVHAANSAAILNFPAASAFDQVRPGLLTYGVWPTDSPPETMPVKPVLSWQTRIALLKNIPAGGSIGYGRTYVTPQRMWAAVLPVGYADGYRFALSNRAEVLVHGKRCPVRGRVSMDQTVVDVTNVPGVAAGDVVTLIGTDRSESITVNDLAKWAGTISYDILTGIGPRVERVYKG